MKSVKHWFVRPFWPVALVLAAAAMTPSASRADLYIFDTPTGAVEPFGGNPVSAEAKITTGNGTITVTLNNLLVDPHTVAQNISGFEFTLEKSPSSASLTSSSGTLRNVAKNGTYTDSGSGTTGWKLTRPTSDSIFLNGLGSAAFTPSHTIIGAPNGLNKYATGGSIAGNKPHNPFLANTVTFNISAPGVTTATDVTGVTFFFGTEAGDGVTVTQAAPEPATLTMAGFAIVGLTGYGWRRWKRAAR